MKNWTILIYANGNNEFEPEMYQVLLDAEKIGSSKNLNILLQIGREKRELTQILRPSDPITTSLDQWTGVRRYCLQPKKNSEKLCSNLVKDLGKINMAEPKTLYDFIKWGMENYPAKNYMLIMGGHSFEYLGILTDYSQNLPYIMGIPEIGRVFSLIKKNIGQEISLLVLDTCYMNMVEVLYELAKEKKQALKNVLTYIEYGPLQGLPVNKLLNIVEENSNLQDLNLLTTRIIEGLNFDLVAFTLNNKKLEKIKRLSNDLAQHLLRNYQNTSINLTQILEKKEPRNKDQLLSEYVKNLEKNIQGLIIASKRVANQKSKLLSIAHKKTNNKLAAYYFRLSFAKNNHWPQVLGINHLQENLPLEDSIQLKPIVLPLQALVSLISIMNPSADDKQIGEIVQNLLQYKNWQQYSNVKLKSNRE